MIRATRLLTETQGAIDERPRKSWQGMLSCTWDPKAVGLLMKEVNGNSNGKYKIYYKKFKCVLNQVVLVLFPGGHVQVQPQGSTRKGTCLSTGDWDFFVRLDKTVETVTKQQRIDLVKELQEQLNACGMEYTYILGMNKIHLNNGHILPGLEALPKIDIVFARFKDDVRVEPNSKTMANSHVGQQVVKLIKAMPDKYTNLKMPISFFVEEMVRQVEAEITEPLQLDKVFLLVGKEGFSVLLGSCLRKLGRREPLTDNQISTMQCAGMHNNAWIAAARCCYKELCSQGVL